MKTSNYTSAVFVFAFEQGMSFGTASAVGTVVGQEHGLSCQHTSAGCAAVQLLLMGAHHPWSRTLPPCCSAKAMLHVPGVARGANAFMGGLDSSRPLSGMWLMRHVAYLVFAEHERLFIDRLREDVGNHDAHAHTQRCWPHALHVGRPGRWIGTLVNG